MGDSSGVGWLGPCVGGALAVVRGPRSGRAQLWWLLRARTRGPHWQQVVEVKSPALVVPGARSRDCSDGSWEPSVVVPEGSQ